MKYLIFLAVILVGGVSSAQDITINGQIEIMQFLSDNPVAMHSPLAVQLASGVAVKVTSISYAQCDQGKTTYLAMTVSNAAGLVISKMKDITVPCPK